ncbi:hypothetical protein IWQ60_009415 [Tieghemiomyces parasiticus]|uniref:Uncharacterized protein n=1 Tax=Tieghemiomyces parasiticus TaxID=78921 RepID=A0A9W8DJX9_9FUNG|nr:hypothetical protein IWQ60_009415 [Tieghemiomyces parasiticus]
MAHYDNPHGPTPRPGFAGRPPPPRQGHSGHPNQLGPRNPNGSAYPRPGPPGSVRPVNPYGPRSNFPPGPRPPGPVGGNGGPPPNYGAGPPRPRGPPGPHPLNNNAGVLNRQNKGVSVNADDILSDYYQESTSFAEPRGPTLNGYSSDKPERRFPNSYGRPDQVEMADLNSSRSLMGSPGPYQGSPNGSGYFNPAAPGRASPAGYPSSGDLPPRTGPGPRPNMPYNPHSGPGPNGGGFPYRAPTDGPMQDGEPDYLHRRPSDTSTILPSDSVSQYGQAPPMHYRPPPPGRFGGGPPPYDPRGAGSNGGSPAPGNANLANLESPLPAGVQGPGVPTPGSGRNAVLDSPLPPGVTVSQDTKPLSVTIPSNGYGGGIPPSPPPPPLPYNKGQDRYAAYENSRGCCACLNCCPSCCSGCCSCCCIPPIAIFIIIGLILIGAGLGIYFAWPHIIAWINSMKK